MLPFCSFDVDASTLLARVPLTIKRTIQILGRSSSYRVFGRRTQNVRFVDTSKSDLKLKRVATMYFPVGHSQLRQAARCSVLRSARNSADPVSPFHPPSCSCLFIVHGLVYRKRCFSGDGINFPLASSGDCVRKPRRSNGRRYIDVRDDNIAVP